MALPQPLSICNVWPQATDTHSLLHTLLDTVCVNITLRYSKLYIGCNNPEGDDALLLNWKQSP